MIARLPALAAVATVGLTLVGCCGPEHDAQAREELGELGVTRPPKISLGGMIEMPLFTDAAATAMVRDGTTEKQLVDLFELPSRKLPAPVGELWVWDMEVYRQHAAFVVHVVGRKQRGDAVQEWRTIPDFMVFPDWLKPDMDVSTLIDNIGSPDRWEMVAGEKRMVWERAVQLVRQDHSWVYSAETWLHSLRLRVVDDHVRAIAPLASRKLETWPASASQLASAAAAASDHE